VKSRTGRAGNWKSQLEIGLPADVPRRGARTVDRFRVGFYLSGYRFANIGALRDGKVKHLLHFP